MSRKRRRSGRKAPIEQTIVIAATAAMAPFAYIGNRAGEAFGSSSDLITAIGTLPQATLASIARNPLSIGTSGAALIGALLASMAPWLAALALLMYRQKPSRAGEEHGSARFADPSELAGFREEKNPDPEYNTLLLTEGVGLAISREGYSRKYDRNLNVLVVGGSGAGKTRYYVKPNIAQRAGDFIVTDPKGDLIADVGQGLVDAGYEVSCFNTFLPDRSLVYNPLHYVRTDLDIESFAKMFVHMTKGDSRGSSDPFWENAEILLYTALIAFLRDYMGPADYNMSGLMRLLAMAKVMEDREDYESPLDKAFLQIETGYISVPAQNRPAPSEGAKAAPERLVVGEGIERKPSNLKRNSDHRRPYDNLRPDGRRGFPPAEDFALYNYKNFKQAAGKTLKSIIISCNVRLAPFATSEVKAITCGRDEMHLERFGDPGAPRALFLVFKDTDQRTLGFLHGMIVYQAVNVLCQKALERYGGRLPRFVNFILDEYRSLSLPEDISAMISVVRSRNIGMSIILQAITQLGELYDEKAAASIMACCDTVLFLGSNQPETTKYISDLCGQQTVVDYNITASHGGSGGWSKAASKIARPLIAPDEVARLPAEQAIVQIRGAAPCMDEKFPLEEHPRAAEVDAEKKFDLNKHMESTRPRRRRQPAARALRARPVPITIRKEERE